ncbi:phage/plasmid primase, P4 family [Sphingomonas adhaesiva]|uniref:phage/plasmid primase, P4 family n=1 Tax=Sphingomonas adhaesiva TaxID=28212 RepID=UPI002FFD47F0
MTAGSEMLHAALEYARRGWPVFPCNARDKTPLVKADRDAAGKPIKGTGGVKQATTDVEKVAAWWRRWPSAMIGVAMGENGLFALDFDPRTDEATGEEWTLERLKAELETQIGASLPASLAVRTPSGGVHVYLSQPAEGASIRNRGNLPRHVDVRGAGGYVIAPPSRMIDGRSYRWLRDDRDALIAEPPAGLVTVLRAKGAKGNGQSAKPQGDGVERYALAALDSECQAIRSAEAGKRQDALNRGAFAVAQLVAAGALAEPSSRMAVLAAALANPGKDDQSAIEATVDSGWAAGLAAPRDLTGIGERARTPYRQLSIGKPARSAQQDAGEPDGGAIHRRCCLYPMTDLGNAERFAERYGDRVRYVDKMGWVAYDGRRFILDGAEALIGGWVHETVRAIRDEARVMRDSGRRDLGQVDALDDLFEEKKDGSEVLLSDKLLAWARASESATKLGCIAGIAKNLSGFGMTVQPEHLDRDPFLINVQNGTLELVFHEDAPEPFAQLRLRSHDPRDLITRVMPVEYRPGAQCPIYDRFLARVQPDEAMRLFLHRWGGLSLTGDVSEQKLVFHHGKGANGKSTLVDTWATIAGDYSGTVPIETFLDQGRKRKGSDASPDLAALVGVRMLRTSEAERNAKLAEALIKLATGGEPIPVRRLMRDPFDLYPAFKMTISGNYFPTITGSDDGIWRRVALVPWNIQIPDAEKDRQLGAKMRREASGILNRLLDGLIDWRLRGLQEPDIVRTATDDYRKDSDPLGRFLTECTADDTEAKTKSSVLYGLYDAWRAAVGENQWTQKGFSLAMLDRGYKRRENRGMQWLGIRMTRTVSDFEQASDEAGGGQRYHSPRPLEDADDMPL